MPNPHLKLTSEVKYLKGVGPTRAELLAARGIHTVEDLLYYTPFRYEDRTRLTAISNLVPGQTATILANVLTCGLTRTRRGTYMYDLAAIDASGAPNPRMIRCIWFNARYLERNKVFRSGQKVFFYGKAEPDFLPVVKLFTPDMGAEQVRAGLLALKQAPILKGWRGAPALDVDALADLIVQIGRVMTGNPRIREIDLNPVIIHPEGQGVAALDALMLVEG